MRSPVPYLILPLVLVGLVRVEPVTGQTPNPKQAAQSFTLYHTFGTKADKESIPKGLRPFRASLLRTGYQSFTSAGASTIKLIPGQKQTVDLPKGMGHAEITLNGNVVSVRLVNEKSKSLGSYRSTRFPQYIVTDKLKSGGAQYILILKKNK